jgi:hypothetical protein
MPAEKGGPVTFTVNGISGSCEWKIFTKGGEESRTTDIPTLTLDSSADLRYVIVKDSNNNTGRYIFEGAIVEEDDDGFDIPVTTVAVAGAAGVGILGFIILVLRRILRR